MTHHQFRIFVAPYTDSTAGQYLDPLSPQFDEEVDVISQGGAVEVFAPDHEGFFGYRSESVSELADLARAAAEKDCPEAFIEYVIYVGATDFDAALSDYTDAFCGYYDSEEEYAAQLAEEIFTIPKEIAPYFDHEKFARDLFIGDYFSVRSGGGVYVFRSV